MVERLNTTTIQLAAQLSQGYPGAMRVLLDIVRNAGEFDLTSPPSLAYLVMVDTIGLRGPDIWVLHKDICGQSVELTMGVLRACQLGFVPEEHVLRAARTFDRTVIDPRALLEKVRDYFGPSDWKAKESIA